MGFPDIRIIDIFLLTDLISQGAWLQFAFHKSPLLPGSELGFSDPLLQVCSERRTPLNGLKRVTFQNGDGGAVAVRLKWLLNPTKPFNVSFRNDGCCSAELESLHAIFSPPS